MASWSDLEIAFDADAYVSAAARGRLNPLPGAQDHLPAAYAVARGFVSEAEAAALHAFFAGGTNPHIERTMLSGDELADGQAPDPGEALVRQLYGNPQPFRDAFPAIWTRLLALKDALGTACGLETEELQRVSFAQDIRHITYGPNEECPWHRDDPTSHFVVMVMLTDPHGEPGFEGGRLVVHGGTCEADEDAMPVWLEQGDAIILSAPRVDHAVQRVTDGARVVCIFELACPKEEPPEEESGVLL